MKDSGFTLIEVLVTVAVMSILVAVAMPSFQTMMADNRVRSDYNELLVGLNFARSEAIKRRKKVTFDVTGTLPWEYQVKVEGTAEPLRVRRAGDGAVSVEDEAFAVTFDPLGKATNCASGCSVTLTHASVPDRVIGVNAMGRVGRGASS